MSRDITQCGREDLNLHPRRDRDLNPARLPIPPHPRGRQTTEQRARARGSLTGTWGTPGYSHPVPTSPSAPSPVTPDASASTDATDVDTATDVADRIHYLDEVMPEIDAEVRRRRASGD